MSIIAYVTEEGINCLTLMYSGNTRMSNKIILREQRRKNTKS